MFCNFQLNFLIVENRPREIIDPTCEGTQIESLDALLSVAIQCVSSSPEDRPTMHRVVQMLESEVMTPCPSDFYDSNSDWVVHYYVSYHSIPAFASSGHEIDKPGEAHLLLMHFLNFFLLVLFLFVGLHVHHCHVLPMLHVQQDSCFCWIDRGVD